MRERLGSGLGTAVGMRTAGECDRHSDGVTVVACLGQIEHAFMNKCLFRKDFLQSTYYSGGTTSVSPTPSKL